ncbi:MAG TPA: Uma2 family endonuclease [Thermoanaerobaculia bacterium]|nr:Uma2 family endonuclease [Thermoanaerobaculia bacterium]
MAVHDKRYVTPEEYLALERAAERKSEYRDGEIVGMTGATRRHSLITVNVSSELNRQLKGRPCEVHVNDLRVLIAARRLYTYPDVIVVCGEPALADRYRDILTNPTVLIEVLSPSTEAYDRGTKFEHYRTLDSLREYLLVSQSRPQVDHFMREDDGPWLLSAANDLTATIVLPSIQCQLAMAEIYDKVKFGEIES